jgi:lysozyme
MLTIAMLGMAAPAGAGDFIPGIDVSRWQGDINWTSVKNSGIQFAFAKATEGVDFVDIEYHQNMQGARAAGVYIGPYHFCRIDSLNGVPFTSYDGAPFLPGTNPYIDAVSEANDFIDAIRPYYRTGQHLPPVADVERQPDFATIALERAFVSNWVQLFSDTVDNALGVRPIVYTSRSSANTYFTSNVAAGHELWISWWKGTGTTSPPLQSDTPLWNRWLFWQWTESGTTPGIAGDVDQDVFEGTPEELAALLLGKDDSIPGDFNRDGAVDSADYVLWRNALGNKVPLYTAVDANGNALADAADFGIWQANYGRTLGSGAAPPAGVHTIPEPSSGFSVALLILLLGGARSRVLFQCGE